MPLINNISLIAVVPAAGVGKRMLSDCPKQYLTIGGRTIIEHTLERLLSHSMIKEVIVVLGKEDGYFAHLNIASHPQIRTVYGGKERVDSVLAGLKVIDSVKYPWVLVHDAARPCVKLTDIDSLISHCIATEQGASRLSSARYDEAK